jgi:hypothetical protein
MTLQPPRANVLGSSSRLTLPSFSSSEMRPRRQPRMPSGSSV